MLTAGAARVRLAGTAVRVDRWQVKERGLGIENRAFSRQDQCRVVVLGAIWRGGGEEKSQLAVSALTSTTILCTRLKPV